MATFPLRLDRYFFPDQSVRANPSYDAAGNRSGTAFHLNMGCAPIEDRPKAYAVELTVSLDEEKSENPPYFFKVSAFAILVADEDLPQESALSIAESSGVNILIGAVREHLASLSARGPWGPFILGPVPLKIVPIAGENAANASIPPASSNPS